MILSTTEKIENKEIEKYLGLVFGEVVNGINFVIDMGAELVNFLGGRSSEYEKEIVLARKSSLEEMKEQAKALGADAVVGIKFEIETLGNGNMILINTSGTAVKLK